MKVRYSEKDKKSTLPEMRIQKVSIACLPWTKRSITRRLIFSIDDLPPPLSLPLFNTKSNQLEFLLVFLAQGYGEHPWRWWLRWMAHFARFDVMGIRGFTRDPGIKIIQTSILFIALSAFGIFSSGLILDRRPNGIVISPLWFNFIKYERHHFDNENH